MRNITTWNNVENYNADAANHSTDSQNQTNNKTEIMQTNLETKKTRITVHANSNRKVLMFLLFAFSTVTLLTACSKKDVTDDINNSTQKPRLYRGTVTTTARSVDAYGRPFSRDYQGQVEIEVSKPLEAQNANQKENNPFHFSIFPYPNSAAGDEGQYSILSAGINLQGSLTGELLVQYWQLNQNGTTISGTLTNPQNALAASANLINLPYDITGGVFVPYVYAMDQGTSFSGTMTDQEIRIEIEGNAIDGVHPFESEIVAARVQ